MDDKLQLRAREAARLRLRVHDDMLARKGEKYAKWLQTLEGGRTFLRSGSVILRQPFFARAAQRLELIDTIYAFGRIADDRADGDAPLPEGWTSASAYIEHLLQFLTTRNATGDEAEFLLDYVVDLGDSMGIDVRYASRLVLESLLFDARRRESPQLILVPAATLEANYFRLDEEGTIKLCLTILGERLDSFETISLLGVATRIMYTLRDLREDMYARLCNVPREDFDTYGMYVPDVSSQVAIQQWYDSGATRLWRSEKAVRGLELYETYDRQWQTLSVHWFTRTILEYMYERSTKAGLEDVLKAA